MVCLMNPATETAAIAARKNSQTDREWMTTLRDEFALSRDQLAADLDVTVTYLTALEEGTLPLSRPMYQRITRAITERPQPVVRLDCTTPGCTHQGTGHNMGRVDVLRGEPVVHTAFEDERDNWIVTVSACEGSTWGVWTTFETDTDPGTSCQAWAEYSATVTGAFHLAHELNNS
jgi:DNA-binding transcriptional regulator YiaG